MTTIYHINITDGTITFDYALAPRIANKYHAPNAKQYFVSRRKEKPKPVAVRGWPFTKIYMTHGTEENGQAVAWV